MRWQRGAVNTLVLSTTRANLTSGALGAKRWNKLKQVLNKQGVSPSESDADATQALDVRYGTNREVGNLTAAYVTNC